MFILSGVRLICSPYSAIKSAPCFARADNGKMRAANESYTLKMNIIVILVHIFKAKTFPLYSCLASSSRLFNEVDQYEQNNSLHLK